MLRGVTSAGWATAAATVAFAVASAVLRFPELSVLAVGSLAALVAAAVAVGRPPSLASRVEVVPARVERGGAAVARVTVQNVGERRTGSFRIHLPHGGTSTDTRLRSLAPGARRVIAVPLPTDRRGVVNVGPVVARWADPFSLAERERVLGETAVVHVHPMVHHLTPLPSARASSPDGLPVDSATEGGVTFHALREYVPGDDPRHLHWRSSAKAGALLVRQHVDPSQPVTTVLLDVRAAAYPAGSGGQAAFDAAVDAAASILLASARRRFPVELRTTAGERLVCRANRGDEHRLLDALARVELSGARPDSPANATSPDLAGAVRGLARRGLGTLALVSGDQRDDQVGAVAPAVSWFEHVVIARIVETPAAAAATSASAPAPGAAGPAAVFSGGSGRLRVLDVADAAALAAAWPASSRPRLTTGQAR